MKPFQKDLKGKDCSPEGFAKTVKELTTKGRDKFFTWFDGGGTVDGAFNKAEGIFLNLIYPHFLKYRENDPIDSISLDIGYGGGGQVLAATKFFNYALGVDVHGEKEYVIKELVNRSSPNYVLFQTNGMDLQPIMTGHVDFVHSWVTLIHVGYIEVVKSYISECFRVLRPGGVGVLFFSRLVRSKQMQTEKEWFADLEEEKEHPIGYIERGTWMAVNTVNLKISMWWMVDELERQRFTIMKGVCSNSDGFFHGQQGVVFKKDFS